MDAWLSHTKLAHQTCHSCFRTHAYYLIFFNKKYSFTHDLNNVYSHTYSVYKPSYILHKRISFLKFDIKLKFSYLMAKNINKLD